MPSFGELSSSLSTDERERAVRFARPTDREAFVIRRGLLRTVLGRYTGVKSSALAFTYGRYGKPFLCWSGRLSRLSFSLTHSADLVLIAVAAGRSVGVDVEAIDGARAVDAVASLYLPDGAGITGLATAEKRRAFCVAWTNQEAYLKAKGVGLTEAPADYHADDAYTVETIVPLPGYIGAIAAEGSDWRVSWCSAAASSARCSVRQVT